VAMVSSDIGSSIAIRRCKRHLRFTLEPSGKAPADANAQHGESLAVAAGIDLIRKAPLLLGRLDLPNEGLKMLDRRLADAPRAGIACIGHAVQDSVRNCFTMEQNGLRLATSPGGVRKPRSSQLAVLDGDAHAWTRCAGRETAALGRRALGGR
jgi:hypothetical protein